MYQLDREQQELVDKIGGKSASIEWVRTQNKSILIPDYILLSDLEKCSIISKLNEQKDTINFSLSDLIIRGSTRGDEKGLVGILDSSKYPSDFEHVIDNETENNTIDNLLIAINHIISNSNSDFVKNYAREFDGFEYEGLDSILLMQYIYGNGFSVVQHPNIRGHYVVSGKFDTDDNYEYLINENGEVIYTSSEGDFIQRGFSISDAIETINWKKIIDFSKEVDACGFIPEEFSSQKEFVMDYENNVYFLQQRFFLPFNYSQEKTPEDFRSYGFISKGDSLLKMGKSGEIRENGHLYDPSNILQEIDLFNSINGIEFQRFPSMGRIIGNGGNLRAHDSYRLILKYRKSKTSLIY